MARVFITGSTDGLGAMSARLLIDEGHRVVLHARNASRADDAHAATPNAEAIVTGDLSNIAAMRDVAEQANRLGHFDAIIHNVGIGYREPRRIETADGLPHVFATNVLAPYVLTALIARPQRLVFLSSGMHHGSRANLGDIEWTQRRWNGAQAYAESKFMDVLLALAVARRWPDVLSNALEPGWVPTKMGGPSAPDNLDLAHRTQAWLAVSDDDDARVSGRYFFHMRERACDPSARDEALQDKLIAICERLSGVKLER
ncbi:SDR family NAD(P)-dependent oxidoreductase [Caballeronia insecticola]|uniref:Putative daunorubicin C-13 ketoreductase n=1 Tax=Caballeronia insecticola TaxID=758793 RepID=R4X104_9BURK|nr:SDR family NAD(P)-dependent oxidoreductase [Caballeronia insecticola]BAN24697.1 putative daunorubicin C-13 ketoreductase [Caballeronia insecticola]